MTGRNMTQVSSRVDQRIGFTMGRAATGDRKKFGSDDIITGFKLGTVIMVGRHLLPPRQLREQVDNSHTFSSRDTLKQRHSPGHVIDD